MSEQFDQRTRARVQALHAYTIALEQSDLETVARVLQQAEQDVALERMILELHAAGLDSAHLDHQGVPVVLDQEEIATERTPDMASEYIHLNGAYPHSRSRHTQQARSIAFLQALAAVLIIGALISSFALLLAHHPGSPGHAGRGKPTPISGKPTPGQNQPAPTNQNFYVTAASNNGTIYALQAKTGHIVWQYATHQEVDMMVQQGGILYVSTSGSGTRPNYLYKFRLSDGKLLWEKYYPQLEGYSVIVVDGNAIAISGGEGDGSLDVVSANDGSLLWRYVPSGGSATWSYPIIAEHNQVLYIRIYNNGMEAVQLTTGKLLWTSTASPDTLVFVGKVLYGINALSYTVTRQDINTGKEIGSWRFSPNDNLLKGGYDATTLYISKGGLEASNQVCALRLSNGAQRWCLPKAKTSLIVPPALINATFSYIQVSQDNHWIADSIHTSNGSPRWHWTNGGTINLMNDLNIVGAGRFVFITTPRSFYALASNDGHVLWQSLKGVNPAPFALPSVPGQILQLPN